VLIPPGSFLSSISDAAAGLWLAAADSLAVADQSRWVEIMQIAMGCLAVGTVASSLRPRKLLF
jgi:hypothetical protein